MKVITLNRGYAFQNFTVTLGENTLKFQLKWLTRYSYYSVNIWDIDNNVIANGSVLHPGVDLLSGINTNIGKIILEGEQPTINNLGIDNRLTWYEYNE